MNTKDDKLRFWDLARKSHSKAEKIRFYVIYKQKEKSSTLRKITDWKRNETRVKVRPKNRWEDK